MFTLNSLLANVLILDPLKTPENQLISGKCSHMIPPENTRKPIHFWSMFSFYTAWKHQKTSSLLAYVLISYLLKTVENLWFCVVFRGYKMRTLARNGLMRALYYFLTDDIRKIIKNPDLGSQGHDPANNYMFKVNNRNTRTRR